MNKSLHNRRWLALGSLAALALIFGVCDPLGWRLFPRCILHSATGLYCPGCGTSRAFAELVHCHFLAALRLNAVTILMVPLVGILWATGKLEGLKPVWIWSLMIVIISFGVMRNLPWYPFTLLIPHP